MTALFVDGCRTLCERLHLFLLPGRVTSSIIPARQGYANQGAFHALLSCWPTVQYGTSYRGDTEDYPLGV